MAPVGVDPHAAGELQVFGEQVDPAAVGTYPDERSGQVPGQQPVPCELQAEQLAAAACDVDQVGEPVGHHVLHARVTGGGEDGRATDGEREPRELSDEDAAVGVPRERGRDPLHRDLSPAELRRERGEPFGQQGDEVEVPRLRVDRQHRVPAGVRDPQPLGGREDGIRVAVGCLGRCAVGVLGVLVRGEIRDDLGFAALVDPQERPEHGGLRDGTDERVAVGDVRAEPHRHVDGAIGRDAHVGRTDRLALDVHGGQPGDELPVDRPVGPDAGDVRGEPDADLDRLVALAQRLAGVAAGPRLGDVRHPVGVDVDATRRVEALGDDRDARRLGVRGSGAEHRDQQQASQDGGAPLPTHVRTLPFGRPGVPSAPRICTSDGRRGDATERPVTEL